MSDSEPTRGNIHAIFIVHISPRNVMCKAPGATSALEPGSMARLVTYQAGLDHLNWFQRSGLLKSLKAQVKVEVEKTKAGSSQTRTLSDNMSMCITRTDSQNASTLAVAVVADTSLAGKALARIPGQVLSEFNRTFKADDYEDSHTKIDWPPLKEIRMMLNESLLANAPEENLPEQLPAEGKKARHCNIL